MSQTRSCCELLLLWLTYFAYEGGPMFVAHEGIDG